MPRRKAGIRFQGQNYSDSLSAAEVIVAEWLFPLSPKELRVAKSKGSSEVAQDILDELDVPRGVLVGDLEEVIEDYFDSGGRRASVSKKQIKSLKEEAKAAGDTKMVKICDRALKGDKNAISDCEDVIDEAKAARTASDTLLNQVVRLAYEKPNLRKDLLPVIAKEAGAPRW